MLEKHVIITFRKWIRLDTKIKNNQETTSNKVTKDDPETNSEKEQGKKNINLENIIPPKNDLKNKSPEDNKNE